jgi:hypothetical protein
MKGLVLFGLDPRVLEIGLAAVRANATVVGLWDPSHDRALEASLHLGCCAYPGADELLQRAERVLYSTWPGELRRFSPSLDVTGLTIDGRQILGDVDEEWWNWLQSMGFDRPTSG